jgi:N-acetylglucosamine-6-phosphate deacetylase
MPPLAIMARRALTPSEEIADPVVLVENGIITAVGPRESIGVPSGARLLDAGNVTLVPGFVDVHIHGAGGHDVMEATPEALAAVTTTAARFGTTSLLATTVSASLDATCRSLEAIADYIRGQSPGGAGTEPRARILGIHFEGPFLSLARRGVHPPECLATPSLAVFSRLLDAAQGYGRLLTLAPELAGAPELVREAAGKGLVVGMGHTDATYSEAREAIRLGARHAVHVFNAMRPFSHRETGILGAVLTSPEVTAELIADGVHVDAPAMRLLLATKGAARVLLISDGTAATGMPDGNYRLGTFDVTVKGGVSRNAEGVLAGSTLTLDRAVRTIVNLGIPLADAVRMATLTPARLLGMDKHIGVLATGAVANLVFLDERLNIAGVIVEGRELH